MNQKSPFLQLESFENKNEFGKVLQEYRNYYANEIHQNEDEFLASLANKLKLINVDEVIDWYKSKFEMWLFEINHFVRDQLNNMIEETFAKEEYRIREQFLIELNKSSFVKTKFDEQAVHDVSNRNLLFSSVSGVYDTCYYDSHLKELAVIWYRLVNNHPFTNGNKRTAMIGIKLHFITSIIDNAQQEFKKNIDKKYKDLNYEFFNNNKQQIKHEAKKLGIRVSKKKLEQAVAIMIERVEKHAILNQKHLNQRIIQMISKLWENENSEEDYLISIYLAKKTDHSTSNDELEKVYELIENNLLSFYGKGIFIINSFFSDIQRALFLSQQIEISKQNYFLILKEINDKKRKKK